jgi:hypothetical protein
MQQQQQWAAASSAARHPTAHEYRLSFFSSACGHACEAGLNAADSATCGRVRHRWRCAPRRLAGRWPLAGEEFMFVLCWRLLAAGKTAELDRLSGNFRPVARGGLAAAACWRRQPRAGPAAAIPAASIAAAEEGPAVPPSRLQSPPHASSRPALRQQPAMRRPQQEAAGA